MTIIAKLRSQFLTLTFATGYLELIRHPARSGVLILRHALCRFCAWRGSRLRRILRRALGLQLLGVEDAVASKTAVGQGLRVVLESVGRGLGPGIGDGQRQVVF